MCVLHARYYSLSAHGARLLVESRGKCLPLSRDACAVCLPLGGAARCVVAVGAAVAAAGGGGT